MQSRAARGAGVRGRREGSLRGAARATVEALEGRRLLSVTNLIEGATSTEALGLGAADPSGAVGPNHVVDAVNTEIQWFTKAGVNQTSEQLYTFFAPLGTTTDSVISEPRVIFDQYNQRFLVAVMTVSDPAVTGGLTNDSHVLLAVSKDADPNDGFFYQDIRTKLTVNGTDAFVDFPQIAVSQNAIYLTGNMLPFSGLTSATATTLTSSSSPTTFLGSRLWVIPKTPLYTGPSGASFVSGPFDPMTATGVTLTADSGVFALDGAATLTPAQMYGTTPTGVGTYLTFDAGIDAGTGHNLLGVIRVDNPLGVPVFTKQIIDVGTTSSKNFHGAPQPDVGTRLITTTGAGLQRVAYLKIDSNDERMLSAVWRNGFLYAANEVIPTSGADLGQVTAHWYQVSTGSATAIATPALYDQGNVGGEEIGVGVNTYYPALSVNARGDLAIGFSASGPTSFTNNQTTTPTSESPVFAGAYVTARLVGDPKGQVRPSIVLAAGEDFFVNDAILSGGAGRFEDTSPWGAYSSVGLNFDSSGVEQTDFWAFNMYALPRADDTALFSDEWGTRWGNFTPELLDLPAVGNLVWSDLNGNGIRDVGEPGLEGVTFQLYDAQNNLVDQTVSDANGMWYLQAAPAGNVTAGSGYKIVADISAVDPTTGRSLFDGFTYSPYKEMDPTRAEDPDTIDSDFEQSTANPFQAVTNAGVSGLTLVAGTLYENFDLGLFKPFAKITATTPTVAEGGPGAVHQATFTVSLSTGIRPSVGMTTPVTSPWTTRVYYSTVAISATSDVDYQSHTADLVTIAPGQTSSSLNVAVYGDTLPEGSETFKVEIIEPSTLLGTDNLNLPPGVPPTDLVIADTAQILPADQAAVATILDDDLAVLSVDAGPTVVEGGAGTVSYALFTIRLSTPNPLQVPVTVKYVLVNGTATGGASALDGVDYDNTAGSVTFAPGQLTKTVRVAVYGDFLAEGNETFSLVVSPADPGQLTPDTPARRTATATIVNLGLKTMSFSAKKSVTYTDIAGVVVTITLSGPGKGSVTTTKNGVGRVLMLNGTTEKSVLTVRTRGGQTTFGGIQINGGLAALNAATSNLNGSLVSTGAVRSLTMNYVTDGAIVLGPSNDSNVFLTLNVKRVADSTLSSETSIKTFNLGSWIDTGHEDFLLAPAIKTIHATGDFGASVSPTNGNLGSLTVDGVMKGSTVSVVRSNGSGKIGTIKAGSLVNSDIEAGAKIDSVLVKKLFSNSTILAPRIKTLELARIQNTTGSVLTAAEADFIASVRWTFNNKTQRITDVDNPGPRGLDKDLDKNPQIILQIT